MWTKAKIYNVALGALLLQRQIVDPSTDTSNEAKVLNQYWEVAFKSALEDLDLDSTASFITLELIASNPLEYWDYVYKYPSSCLYFRRIRSSYKADNRYSAILKEVAMYNGTTKAIFTNEENAVAEYISSDIPLSSLSMQAGLAIGYRLAMLAAPLNVGKGARELKKSIKLDYIEAKMEAQEHDKRENFNFRDPALDSEFVAERMS